MKKELVLLVCILIFSCENQEDIKEIRYNTHNGKLVRETYKNNKLIIVEELMVKSNGDTVLNGKTKVFHLTGKPYKIVNYKDDQLIGEHTTYHDNGFISIYKAGNSKQKYLYKREYDKKGNLDSVWGRGIVELFSPDWSPSIGDTFIMDVLLATPPNCTYELECRTLFKGQLLDQSVENIDEDESYARVERVCVSEGEFHFQLLYEIDDENSGTIERDTVNVSITVSSADVNKL